MDRNVEYLSRWLVTSSPKLAFVIFLLLLVSAAGIPKIQFSSELNDYIDYDKPSHIAYRGLENDYVPMRQLIYVIDFGEKSVISRDNLSLLETLTEAAYETPNASHVQSLTNAQYSYSLDDEYYQSPLFEDVASLTDQSIQQRWAYAYDDTKIVGRLVSPSGNVVGIYTYIEWENALHLPMLIETMNYAEQLKSNLEETHPGVSVHLTGSVSLESGCYDVVMHDLTRIFPLIMCFSLLIFWLLLRSVSMIVLIMLVNISALLMTFGFSGHLQLVFNQTSAMAVLIIFVICTAQMAHVSVSFIALVREGISKKEAIEESFRTNLYPIFLTCITTIAGFLFLNTSASPVFSLMGNVSAVGIALGFILMMSLFPVAVSLLPINIKSYDRRIDHAMSALANGVIRWHKSIFVLSVILVLGSVMMISKNKMNNDIIKYFKPDHPLRVAADFTADNLIENQQLVFSLDSRQVGGVNDPAYLSKLFEFQKWLRQQQQVTRVYSYDQIQKSIISALENTDLTESRLPKSKNEASQNLLLYEISLSEGFSLKQFLNTDRSASRIVIVTRYLENSEMLNFQKLCDQWLKQYWPEVSAVDSSHDLLFAELGDEIIHGMIYSSIATILVITLMLSIGLGSLKYGFLSLIPNAFPSLIVYGLWGVFVASVDISVSVTFCIALGIIVDDTVHILSKYRYAINAGQSPEAAIRYTFRTAGVALYISTVILVGGLLIIAQSIYSVHANIGYIVGATIGVALLFDLLFLPSLLLIIARMVSGKPLKEDVGHVSSINSVSGLKKQASD